MANFSVNYYDTADGCYPAEEFILSQDIKMRAKIFRILELLEDKGNMLRMPYSEYLEDGIFQIRAQIGNDITRVLYFFIADKEIILTNGFVKKTEETPPAEIKVAKKYRADYLNRKGDSR